MSLTRLSVVYQTPSPCSLISYQFQNTKAKYSFHIVTLTRCQMSVPQSHRKNSPSPRGRQLKKCPNVNICLNHFESGTEQQIWKHFLITEGKKKMAKEFF